MTWAGCGGLKSENQLSLEKAYQRMGSHRYLSVKKIALASLTLGVMAASVFVRAGLLFDPIDVGHLVILFLFSTTIFSLVVLIPGLAIRYAVDLWDRLTKS
jgi:hypothetical protein